MQTTIDDKNNVESTKIQLVLKHGNISASFTVKTTNYLGSGFRVPQNVPLDYF